MRPRPTWAGGSYDAQPDPNLAAEPTEAQHGSDERDLHLDDLKGEDDLQTDDEREPAAQKDGADPATLSTAGQEPAVGQREASAEEAEVAVPTAGDLMRAARAAERREAQAGWRAFVRKVTGGAVSPAPSRTEATYLEDVELVNSEWPSLRSIVVANPKGGEGKTPTALGLAATFGQLRGAGSVLALENNETMGTMAQRTAFSRHHDNNIVHLIDGLEHFETRRARQADLGGYLRNQTSGQFKVLVGDQDPHRMALLTREQFARIHDVVGRFFDLVVIDTGNNTRAENFLASIERADALAIPLTWTRSGVTKAGELLDQLRATGFEELAANAIIIARPGGVRVDAGLRRDWRSWFESVTSGIVDVPYDQHIAADLPIEYDHLSSETRRAYLRAAAAVADRLNKKGVRG